MLNFKSKSLIGLVMACGLVMTCCRVANSQSPDDSAQVRHLHKGVLVAGHGTDAFENIFMDVFDILGERGVVVANHGLQKVDQQRVIGFVPLPELIDMLQEVGADSLLYIKVTPGLTNRAATVVFQCFDPNGHILWEEKANDVLVDGGNTVFHPNGWKKKLALRIGGPGLSLRATKEEKQ